MKLQKSTEVWLDWLDKYKDCNTKLEDCYNYLHQRYFYQLQTKAGDMIAAHSSHSIYLIMYSLIFLCVGLLSGSFGPVIPYLASQREVPETQYSFLFVARTAGSVAGFLLLNYIQRKFSQSTQHSIIGVGAITISLFAFVFVRNNSNFWAGASMVAFEGCHYLILTACNICLLRAAQKQAGKWITLVNAVYGLGALASPLVVRMFGTEAFYFFSATYCIVTGLCFYFPVPLKLEHSDKIDFKQEETALKQGSLKLQVGIGLGLFLMAGFESTFSGWLPTFAVGKGEFSMENAATCITLFWVFSTIIRFVSAAVSIKNSLKLKIFISSIFISCVACIILYQWQFYEQMIIGGSIMLGISCSVVYPLLLSISTEYKIRFRPEQLSIMMIAPSFSSLFVAGLTGELMKLNMGFLFYSLAITSGILWLDSMWFFGMLAKESGDLKLSENKKQ